MYALSHHTKHRRVQKGRHCPYDVTVTVVNVSRLDINNLENVRLKVGRFDFEGVWNLVSSTIGEKGFFNDRTRQMVMGLGFAVCSGKFFWYQLMYCRRRV